MTENMHHFLSAKENNTMKVLQKIPVYTFSAKLGHYNFFEGTQSSDIFFGTTFTGSIHDSLRSNELNYFKKICIRETTISVYRVAPIPNHRSDMKSFF